MSSTSTSNRGLQGFCDISNGDLCLKDTVSALEWGPLLAATTWDGSLQLVSSDHAANPRVLPPSSSPAERFCSLSLNSPLLSLAWANSQDAIYVAGGLGSVIAVDVARAGAGGASSSAASSSSAATAAAAAADGGPAMITGSSTLGLTHGGVFKVRTDKSGVLGHSVISADWSNTLAFWDPRTHAEAVASVAVPGTTGTPPVANQMNALWKRESMSTTSTSRTRMLRSSVLKPYGTVAIAESLIAMDARWPFIVAATDQRTYIYDMRNMSDVVCASPGIRNKPSELAISSNTDGYIIGSIGGRCAVEPMSQDNRSAAFSFKCHRNRSAGQFYAITDIAFDPSYPTFTTAGSDGSMHIWCHRSRQRLRNLNTLPAPITAVAYSPTGTHLAAALGYDWHKGEPSGPDQASLPRPRIATIELNTNWRTRAVNNQSWISTQDIGTSNRVHASVDPPCLAFAF
ncbi:WD40 repeat-containing protein [Thecamonas trahens ATCC 50062]|uniref:WD40 repeat-containing protein n=1 Tax=Thecamonas trahens ATCC 50062 TaxID=461836 RepID=A0A0L0DB80_THETB|nr:WD40 repeat-containing protein [Thecamonas trahens ATCC 50062]KNC49572.1 WD40 repeat-containing protein [Thecamonas trahens ATCC 50062]|eukprot:XP_013757681.1 WD40 repeat-containing protein [Thecamonas trahens ATCC 50062]